MTNWPGPSSPPGGHELVKLAFPFAVSNFRSSRGRSAGRRALPDPALKSANPGMTRSMPAADPVVVPDEAVPVAGVLGPRAAFASPATIAGSLSSRGRRRGTLPRDALMTPCCPRPSRTAPPLLQVGLGAPEAGQDERRPPVTRWERLSFVATWAVSAHERSAAAVNSVSGVAERKLPPRRRTPPPPACIALIVSTTSRPAPAGEEGELRLQPVEEAAGASPRSPWCGRPGRCCGRAPGTGRRRAGRCFRAAGGSSGSPGSSRPNSGAG
jgi:hypothetical protein